jgi:hypothetical protein
MSDDNDFGFTFDDELPPVLYPIEKALRLKELIMPLLNNLMKNPENEKIIWPNRKARIEKFIKDMDAIINDNLIEEPTLTKKLLD